MKKVLNSKGMTIVEIILAIGLVSIVMVQVLNLLVDLKNEQVLGESKTEDLSNRSIIIKQVENDFMNKRIASIDDCSLNSKISNRDVYGMKSCVKVVYQGESAKPYFLITATNNDNKKDYFIYGYADTAAATTPTVYEAWRLESGNYPGKVKDATACQFQLQYYDCQDTGCNSRYFVLKYPVLLSNSVSNTTMNFDLEFIYYFRNVTTPPTNYMAHTGFWAKHGTNCRGY